MSLRQLTPASLRHSESWRSHARKMASVREHLAQEEQESPAGPCQLAVAYQESTNRESHPISQACETQATLLTQLATARPS